MPDANQWELVSAGDDLLLPLYRALERHAIEKATNFRSDDTGAMVIAIERRVNAEIAALQSLGESTKGVRTGINATGLYCEAPNGVVVLFYTGRHHAGEIVDQLLRHRLLSSPKLVKCSDGAKHGRFSRRRPSGCQSSVSIGRCCGLRIVSYPGKNGSWVNQQRSSRSAFPESWRRRFASV